MRVLMTADAVGGVWTYARELVTHLARRGVAVTLVGFGGIPAPDRTSWLREVAVDFRPTTFRLEWMQEGDYRRNIAASAQYLTEVAREVRPDIVHLNQFAYGALEFGAPKIVVAHSDVVSWWVAVHGREPEACAWTYWYRALVQDGLRGADVVLTPSHWMLHQLQHHYLRPKSVQVIHNGRSPEIFDPCRTKTCRALSAGRLWDRGKQVDLLRALDGVVPVAIAGADRQTGAGGPAPWSAPGTRIELLGELPEAELCRLYGESALYVATSRYEPFGLAPVEAALSGCAVVANDIPSFRELWGDSLCYFKTNDGASLRQAVERLAADPELRIQCAKRARRHALRYFTAAAMGDAYLKLYSRLAGAQERVA